MLHHFATTTPAWMPPIVVPGYLDPLPLIEYIRAFNEASGSPWVDVSYAADLAYLEASDRIVAPAVYVVPGEERSRDSSDMKVIRQIITCSVVVVSVVRHYRISDRGEAALGELGPIRQRVRDHIIGWRPPGFDNSLRHVTGRLMRFTDEFQIWADEFSADFHFQKLVS